MRLVLPLVLSLLAACGGGAAGPAAPAAAPPPSGAPPPAPSFVSGSTGQTLEAEITPPAPQRGASITVRAPGYLVREATFDGTPIVLWPGPVEYVSALVYTDFTPRSRLSRWTRGFSLTADEDLLGTPSVRDKMEAVAAEAARATGLPVTVGPSGAVRLIVNPNDARLDDAVAVASVSFRGNEIVRGELVFWKTAEITGGRGSAYRNTLLHEVGHALGLGHSDDDRDVMTPGAGPGSKTGVFSENELVCLRMMYAHRRPGNAAPDRDPSVAGAATGESVSVIVN